VFGARWRAAFHQGISPDLMTVVNLLLWLRNAFATSRWIDHLPVVRFRQRS